MKGELALLNEKVLEIAASQRRGFFSKLFG